VYRTNRKGETKVDRSMVGGFTMSISKNDRRPNVRVKHITRRMAFTNFADPGSNPNSRRKRDPTETHTRGFFLDLKTLAAALTSESHSLDSLAKLLEVPGKSSSQTSGDRSTRSSFAMLSLIQRRPGVATKN
jgi:hypothetical protein